MASPPSRVLLTGPAGSGKTHRALDRVRAAATTPGRRGRGAARPGDVLLVLPTYAQAMHLKRVALSRWDARAVLDDPFATFTSAGERFLPAFRVRALPTPDERSGLMEEALRKVAWPAFEAVRDRPGFRSRLLRLVKEVKQSGRPFPEAARRLAAGRDRLGEDGRGRLDGFLRVADAYEELLARAELEDHEDTLRRLLDHLRRAAPLRPPRLLVVDGFDDFTPIEHAIHDALADAVTEGGGEVLVTLPWDERRPGLFDGSRAARMHFLSRGYVERNLEGFPRADDPALVRIATGLFGVAAGEEEPAGPGDAVRLIVAGDPEDEAEAIAREARRLAREDESFRGWRDMGVVVRHLGGAGRRLAAAFERLEIPHRIIGSAGSLASEGIVRAAAGPLAVLGQALEAGRFDAMGLLAWLRYRADAMGDAHGGRLVDALEIRGRQVGHPVDFRDFLGVARAEGLHAVEDLERHRASMAGAQGAGPVYAGLERALIDLVPLPGSAGLDATGRPRDLAGDRRRERAVGAEARLVQIMRGLARAAARTGIGEHVDAAAGVDAVRDGIQQATFLPQDRRLDAVSIFDVEEARFWELPIVFVAGLAQGQFPLLPKEDVLLRDEERARLAESEDGLALPLARDRETRERRLFYGALTRARRRLVLVRPGGTAEGDVRAPSLFLRDVARVVDLGPATTHRPPGRSAPARVECFTRRDWLRFAAATHGRRAAPEADRDLSRALIELADPGLLQRRARWRRALADPVDPSWRQRFEASVARVSTTRLGAMLACRHRHFLGRVVGVPEDEVPFEGPSFGAREKGALVHEALRRALDEPDRSVEEIVGGALHWADTDGRRDARLDDPVERERVARELGRIVRLIRERESLVDSVLQPLAGGLELAFGRKEPLALGRGDGRFLLGGQIDRVDAYGGDAVVMDYKLSRTGAESAFKATRDGEDVQLPLYALAVERLHGLRVVGLEWVAATERMRRGFWNAEVEVALDVQHRRESKKIQVPDGDDFRELLDDALGRSTDAVAEVRAGVHGKQTDDAKRCGLCSWRAVCRPAFQPVVDDESGGW